jgi:hypothetical protein
VWRELAPKEVETYEHGYCDDIPKLATPNGDLLVFADGTRLYVASEWEIWDGKSETRDAEPPQVWIGRPIEGS